MKTGTLQNQIAGGALRLAMLVAVMLMIPAPALRAQPAARKVDSRFLLIFDNSSEMKRRLPAVQKALEILLATSMSQQMHLGDSLGVWTLDQNLHAGQFPLQYWDPDDAVMISTNIISFVSKQRYAKTTSFDALHPLLDQLVQKSERLTVLIFCDGNGEIHGTPYDTGINQIFKQRQGEQQKARAPVVIGLRSQRGQYVGCMVSFPPQPVSLSPFPPLPEPAPVTPPVTNVPPAPPRPPVPPLIIIGTKHESKPPVTPTNLPTLQTAPALPSPAPQPTGPATNVSPPPSANLAAPMPAPEASLNQGVAPLAETKPPAAQTNVIAAPAGTSASERNGGLIVAVVLMASAVGLVFFMWRRSRAVPPASLITRSMNKEEKTPPPQT